LAVGVRLYALALEQHLAEFGFELANQASGMRIRNVFVVPAPATRIFPVRFLILSPLAHLLSPGPTLEPHAFHAQLLKAGLDGREFGSGAL
jgi:hypothetical protein